MLEIKSDGIISMLILSSLCLGDKTIDSLCDEIKLDGVTKNDIYYNLYELSQLLCIEGVMRKNRRRKKYVAYKITPQGSQMLVDLKEKLKF